MEFNKTASNPMLVGAIELLKAEHNKLFITELMKAKFLSPVKITPEPEKDENGNLKMTPENKPQFPMLTAHDGKHYFMAFTDKAEMKKWADATKQNRDIVPCILTMEEFCVMTLGRDSNAAGAVINPYDSNAIIPAEMMMQIMAPRIAQMQAQMRAKKAAEEAGAQSEPVQK